MIAEFGCILEVVYGKMCNPPRRHTQNMQFNCPARLGYAWVSTEDQNLSAQVAALKVAECNMIRTETGSGASLE